MAREEARKPSLEGDRQSSEQQHFSRDYKTLLKQQVLESLEGVFSAMGVANPQDVILGVELKTIRPDQGGDLGFPVFFLAKVLRRNPNDIAQELAQRLSQLHIPYIESFQAVGPYLNMSINYEEYGTHLVREVLEAGPAYGSENIGMGFHYVVDMSSPNIAKPMSVGHLRSTIIGDALSNTMEFLGYRVTKDNHLGDWGTQFGYLMFAIEKYQSINSIDQSPNPITALKDLYVQITAEAKEDESVAQGAREWFLRLEQGDPAARALWQKIAEWSIQEFERVYERLGVTFDVWQGESFYESMLNDAVEYVRQSGAATLSEGAVIVDLRNPYNRLIATWSREIGILLSGLESQENQVDLQTNPWRALQTAYEDGLNRLEDDPESVQALINRLEKGRTKERTAALNFLGILMQEEGGDSEANMTELLSNFFDKKVETAQESIVVRNQEELTGTDLGVQVIRKSDGASLYVTREIATALYREQHMGADGMIYVVGGEQQLYFQQFFELLHRMNHSLAENSHHVWFGMVKGVSVDPETGDMKIEKMSTRKGTTVLLEDVINEAVNRAQKLVDVGDKSKLTETEKIEVATQVAVGALKWNDLKSSPHREIVFNWDEMLSMTGNSAPYVMYSRARALGVLEKAHLEHGAISEINPTHPLERQIVLKIADFPEAVRKVREEFSLAPLAAYLYELAQIYNSLYNELPILNARQGEMLSPNETRTRLALSDTVAQTIENGLRLLGISSPNKM